MQKNVLITGGAGFIGSHLSNELLKHGYRVRVLDNLCAQVHGVAQQRPSYLNPDVELTIGDVRNAADVGAALKGIDVVYHLAAAVGVGQSMYQIAHYTDINNMGTATLLQALTDHPVERLVVASSMSVYGEGLYRASDGTYVEGTDRPVCQMKTGDWELHDQSGQVLMPVPTPETKSPALSSVYALSKYDQERLCLIIGRTYGIPTVALRFFNVYGIHQALSNPYTGVLAIFASRLLNEKAPMIFEDGLQSRDFVSVYDIARACRMALESDAAPGNVFNIGSGQSYTVADIARRIAAAVGKRHLEPQVTYQYRAGDIRHCFADISRAREILNYQPQVSLDSGLSELAEWLEGCQSSDRVDEAHAELLSRGLAI